MHIVLDIVYGNGEVHSFSFAVEDDEGLIQMAQHYAGPKDNWTLFFRGRPIGPYFVRNFQYHRDWTVYDSRQYRLELKFNNDVPMDIENP